MSLYVFDTDTLALYRRGNKGIIARLRANETDTIAITTITVEEALSGWFRRIRQAMSDTETASASLFLARTVSVLASFPMVPLTEAALERSRSLMAARLNVGGNDLRIAAITLEHGGVLVTRNRRDFERVSGLIIEDWSE